MVALQEGEVIGTISIKWKTEFASRQIFPAWKNFYRFGKWNLMKMFIGLSFLDHEPQAGECYIARKQLPIPYIIQRENMELHGKEIEMNHDKGRIVSTRHPPFRKYRLYPLIHFT